jgi:hypothetical protein
LKQSLKQSSWLEASKIDVRILRTKLMGRDHALADGSVFMPTIQAPRWCFVAAGQQLVIHVGAVACDKLAAFFSPAAKAIYASPRNFENG